MVLLNLAGTFKRRITEEEDDMTKPKKTTFKVPKGPCDPEPPKHPPPPTPTKPWDKLGGPNPLKWLKIGKKK